MKTSYCLNKFELHVSTFESAVDCATDQNAMFEMMLSIIIMFYSIEVCYGSVVGYFAGFEFVRST
jgi:hypothetical protein